jgi:hypothetical protein
MTEMASSPLWQDLEALDEPELALLTASAVRVLEARDPASTDEFSTRPRLAIAEELAEELRAKGLPLSEDDARRVVTDPPVSRAIALALLAEIALHPELAGEIEKVYEARHDMMAIDAGLLSAGALLLFALRVKHIKIKGAEIAFYKASETALRQIRTFLGL